MWPELDLGSEMEWLVLVLSRLTRKIYCESCTSGARCVQMGLGELIRKIQWVTLAPRTRPESVGTPLAELWDFLGKTNA